MTARSFTHLSSNECAEIFDICLGVRRPRWRLGADTRRLLPAAKWKKLTAKLTATAAPLAAASCAVREVEEARAARLGR